MLIICTFVYFRTLLDTLLSLQPQRSVTSGESQEDKVRMYTIMHL